jgi:hypothetical protein
MAEAATVGAAAKTRRDGPVGAVGERGKGVTRGAPDQRAVGLDSLKSGAAPRSNHGAGPRADVLPTRVVRAALGLAGLVVLPARRPVPAAPGGRTEQGERKRQQQDSFREHGYFSSGDGGTSSRISLYN